VKGRKQIRGEGDNEPRSVESKVIFSRRSAVFWFLDSPDTFSLPSLHGISRHCLFGLLSFRFAFHSVGGRNTL
jgi:hypothetical protein